MGLTIRCHDQFTSAGSRQTAQITGTSTRRSRRLRRRRPRRPSARTYAVSTSVLTNIFLISRAFGSSIPPHTRRAVYTASRPCFSNADWCLQSDVMPDSPSSGQHPRSDRALYPGRLPRCRSKPVHLEPRLGQWAAGWREQLCLQGHREVLADVRKVRISTRRSPSIQIP